MGSVPTALRQSLHAKKQDVVRQEIWGAAIDLFHECGFDHVNVDQIALRASVSRRTFFRYFSSKEDVLASSTRLYGLALAEQIVEADRNLSGLDVARQAIKIVLAPHLHTTERVLHISERSPAARVAQFLEVPIFERDLAQAFAARETAQTSDAQPPLGPRRVPVRYRMLASVTLSATSICAEMWVAEQWRPLPEIVDEVFTAVVSFSVQQ